MKIPAALKSRALACLFFTLAASLSHAQNTAPPTPSAAAGAAGAPGAAASPAPTPDQISYWFGLMFGSQLRTVGAGDQLAVDQISRGIKDSLQGKTASPAEQQQLQSFVRKAGEAAVARNQAAAAQFLAKNKGEKGIIATPSGLQYRVLAAGNKAAPAVLATDQVTVQYRGKLLDGSEFDSSYARGQPANFPVNAVIKGWQEALVLMKPGAKWQLFVPPELAYGPAPRPGIPGGSLLIFDVELQSAHPAGAAATPPGAPPGTPGHGMGMPPPGTPGHP